MKINLYQGLFNWIDKNWDKTYQDYFELKKYIKDIPKNFSNIQILSKKITYQGSWKFIKVKDIKQKEEFLTIQDFYNNHTFLYSFFLMTKWLEKNFLSAKKFFDFINKINKKDSEKILKDIKKVINNMNDYENPVHIVNEILNNILSILRFKQNSKDVDNNIVYTIKFNDILNISKDIMSKRDLQILFLILSKKFNIISKEKEKLLNSEKVKKILETNDFLYKYADFFTSYKNWNVDIVVKDYGINFVINFLKKNINDFLWLYLQEKLFFKECDVLDTEKYYDFSFKIADNTYRGVTSWENNQLIFTIRIVWKPLDLEEKFFLYIPEMLKKNMLGLFNKKDWLIVVSWSTWSGKTTFLISALDYFNQTDKNNKLIYTVENPIEYWFNSQQYEFIQKQLGKNNDINTMADGIKIALRSQPNMIFVWETRDYATAKELLAATESWHLTITTMHLNNPRDILTRLINLTDTEKDLIQDQLSKNLLATINMWLISAKVTDISTGEKVNTILPYFSILKPDNQIKVLLSEWDSKNIIALFTEYEKIMSGAVWPKELTLLHYFKQWLITKDQIDIIADPMMLKEVEVLYDRIFTKSIDV